MHTFPESSEGLTRWIPTAIAGSSQSGTAYVRTREFQVHCYICNPFCDFIRQPRRAKMRLVKAKKPTPKAIAEKTTATARKIAAKKVVAKKPAPRADLGAPIDGFFNKQPPHLKPILDALRKLVESSLPGTESSLKWGMPFYTLGGGMVCALGAHKAHVNLILAGSPDAFEDPKGLLEGTGKTGRHLKVTTLEGLPIAHIKKWLHTSAAIARSGKGMR